MRPPQAVSAMETDSLRDLRRSEIWVRRSWSWAGGKDWVGFCSCWGGEGSVDVEDDMFFLCGTIVVAVAVAGALLGVKWD